MNKLLFQYWKLGVAIVLPVGKLGIAIAIAVLSLQIRTPLLASLRSGEAIVALMVTSILLILIELFSRPKKSTQQGFRCLTLLVAIAALLICGSNEIKFHWAKQRVLNAHPEQLARLGAHFIIGYHDRDEVSTLIERGAVGGIFLTTRNIQGQTTAEIRQSIAQLQTLRRDRNQPLWIATDQEGGIVSRLSPPLTSLPPLAEIVAAHPQTAQRQQAVRQYARTQAQELATLGITLNFAPVVDLNQGIVNPQDKYSRIYQRAISADQTVVADVALAYCQELAAAGVQCTLKHFPGIGRVEADTHITRAHLDTPLATLKQADWVPFRRILQATQAVTMLSHVQLTALDAERPVSFSNAAIRDLIRRDWQHDGILITDDFCMKAVYGSDAGLESATLQSLNAGMDLILISYDPDAYYPAMAALLNADEAGQLDRSTLAKSQRRLQQQRLPQPDWLARATS